MLVIFLLSAVFSLTTLRNQYNTSKYDIDCINFPSAANYWNLTGTTIYIDDLDPNYYWNKTASENSWCHGNGTWSNPYIIENVTIDGQNARSCIIIKNSDVYFKLRNLNLYNSGIIPSLPTPTYRSGILLSYVNNGQFLNITSSPGHGYGIYMEYCTNLTFTNINASYNYYVGTVLGYSHYNKFTNLYADHMSNHPTLGGDTELVYH